MTNGRIRIHAVTVVAGEFWQLRFGQVSLTGAANRAWAVVECSQFETFTSKGLIFTAINLPVSDIDNVL